MNDTKQVFLTFSPKLIDHKILVDSLIDVIEQDLHMSINRKWFSSEVGVTPTKIFKESLASIRNCDLLIAESSISSTGVGQQISYALSLKKTCIVLLNSKISKNHSSLFLKGISDSNFYLINYTNKVDLRENLLEVLNSIDNDEFEKFNFISTKKINYFLETESKNRKISKSELLREIIIEWMHTNMQ